MTNWLRLLPLIILAIWLSACSRPAQIAVTGNTLEIGDVVNGEIITREISIQNNGQSDLVIETVTTSCGCTQATIKPMLIAAGGSGTLAITFDSGAHGPALTGPIIRQIFITSNDPQQPETIVELAANILPPGDPLTQQPPDSDQ